MATAEQFRTLNNYLLEPEACCANAPQRITPKALSTSVSWEEAQELPEELRAELNISDTDKAEFQILGIIEAQGGTAALDRILVEYYRVTGEVMKRQMMVNRLYRMASKELIYSVPGKKGVYSILEKETDPTPEGLIG
jgi:hypothetical protein